jgi:hypothetical protein
LTWVIKWYISSNTREVIIPELKNSKKFINFHLHGCT